MSTPQNPRDGEVISLRTSVDFKNRLREWADGRGVPMSRLLEEMGELYARAKAGAERKLSAVELLLRLKFQVTPMAAADLNSQQRVHEHG
jgi:hypothetical protein